MVHPLLISLTNILTNFQLKSSHEAFVLLALLPVPKFIHQNTFTKRTHGLLGDDLTHKCLDFILKPLKICASVGIMMSDHLGNLQFVFTPCATYMVNTQEAIMLSGVAGKASHLTLANYRQFSDNFQHPPHTALITLEQCQKIHENADLAHLSLYVQEVMKYWLNGVDKLFWRDWPGTEPLTFFMPEPLHHWHKALWDHDIKWCIQAVGHKEIDFRFSILPHHSGFQQFKEGISKLKQVTGWEHRNIEHYIIPIINGAVTRGFVIAICTLMYFCYLAQAPKIDDNICGQIDHALQEFHANKQAILDANAWVGKGNWPIENWYIPKLEMLQSVIPNIRANGAPYQWSADITEHAHQTVIKDPGWSGNKQGYDTQICHGLDRADRVHQFDLATSICEAGVEFMQSDEDSLDKEGSDNEPYHIHQISTLLSSIHLVSNLADSPPPKNYFKLAQDLLDGKYPHAQKPYWTFSMPSTAFHLTCEPTFHDVSVNEAAIQFGLTDFHPALANFLKWMGIHGDNSLPLPIGGCCVALSDCELPFDSIRTWSKLWIQGLQYHLPNKPVEAQTLMAVPSSVEWPLGQFDVVIANMDPEQQWPQSGLAGKSCLLYSVHVISHIIGHCIAQLHLIFQIQGTSWNSVTFLTYVQCFDIIPQPNGIGHTMGWVPDSTSGLFVLKWATWSGNEWLGDIIPLTQLQAATQIAPHFGPKADPRLTSHTSIEYGSEFWLNKYEDKELFWALHM